MKKALALLLSFTLLALSLTACNKTPKIQKWTWELISVDRDGVMIDIEGRLTAKRGTLTFTDETNAKIYTGTYSDRDEFSPTASDYRITMERAKGHALIVIGENADGESVTNLSLTLGDYSLLFVPIED